MQGIAQLGGLLGGYLMAAGILELFISTYWTICVLFDISLVYIWFRYFYSGDRRNEAATGMHDFESFLPAEGGGVLDVVSFDLSNSNNSNDNNDDDYAGDNADDIDEEAGRRNRIGNDRLEDIDSDGLGEYEHDYNGGSGDDNSDSTRGLGRNSSNNSTSGGGGGGGGAGSSSWSSFIGRRQTLCITSIF